MKQILEGNRIKLRTLKFSDIEDIRKFAKNKKITKYTFVVPPPFTRKQTQVFIKKSKKKGRKEFLIILG